MLSLPIIQVLFCLITQIVMMQLKLCKLGLSLNEVDEALSSLIIFEPQGVVSKDQFLQLRK